LTQLNAELAEILKLEIDQDLIGRFTWLSCPKCRLPGFGSQRSRPQAGYSGEQGDPGFLCGVQLVALEEAVFATEEWLDRARTEARLFAEFTSKMAGAHSVNNVKTMFEGGSLFRWHVQRGELEALAQGVLRRCGGVDNRPVERADIILLLEPGNLRRCV
jgi:hypothetical protein